MSKAGSSTDAFRVMLLGNGGVGKTCITLKFTYDEFEEPYNPSRHDLYSKNVEKDGKTYTILIVDTAGQESYARITDVQIRESDYFLLIFALNNLESFNYCKELRDYVQRLKEPEGPVRMALVGNKVDLVQANPKTREVTKAQAVALAEQWNVRFNHIKIPYVETSAKANININEIFMSALDEILKHTVATETKEKPKKVKKKGLCSIL
ncbi:Ras-related protein Ral-B [Thelohanellus kitauei]|uniref:Ras-related protein Ral-B n=1 Tax=Thelohanellus kitauei TaxID=669202 RepID=A0A0C2I9E7_THEKT|nr:Ras-related protein Ral-B [Thelohanellus kitauei]